MVDDAEIRYRIRWTPADAPVHDDEGIDPDLIEKHAVEEICHLATRAQARAVELSNSDDTLHGHVNVTREIHDDAIEPGVIDWRADQRWIFEDGGIACTYNLS